jgi:hypothetical protein
MTDDPDEDTIRVRRSWPGEPPGADGAETGLDETTAVSRRRTRDPVAEPTTAPLQSEPDAAGPRRSTYIDTPPDAEHTLDGSTIVARRESRRRATRVQAADPDPAPSPAARISAAPAPPPADEGRRATSWEDAHETYGVRRSQPVVAERHAVLPSAGLRPGQAPPDGAAVEAQRRRDDRRATLIVVGTASTIAVAAASALIAIVLSL